MEKVRWGVIGCGGIADKRTIPGMILAQNAECVAVMDINRQIAENVRKKYDIMFGCSTVEELLSKDIDAVYIATPVFCHKEQVFKAADANRHILLEKPMGLSAKEAEEMAAYCEKRGVKLGIGFMMRFHEAHRKIRECLSQGEIGDVVSAYAKFNEMAPPEELGWRQEKSLSAGGAMMDMGIHCIDILQYLTGIKAVEVMGMTGNQIFEYPDTEDAASAIMKMDNGALFTVEAGFNIPDMGGGKFEIYGTKGSIVANGTVSQLEVGEVVITTVEKGEVNSAKLDYMGGNMYTKEIESFSASVIDDLPVGVAADDGIFNQRIVEAVYESQKLGVRIKI